MHAEAALQLYSSRLVYGDFGGPAAADALCAADAPAPCPTARALLCSSTQDARNLFSDGLGLAVTGPTGVPIADSWPALWQGSILNTLAAAGVVEADLYVWTGCSPSGAYWGRACNDWTSRSTPQYGRVGQRFRSDGGWASDGNNRCYNPARLLCTCPPPPTAAPTASPLPASQRVTLYAASALQSMDFAASDPLGSAACAGPCATTPYAFACFSDTHQIATMPADLGFSAELPVVSGDTLVAHNWTQMLAGALGPLSDVSLSSAMGCRADATFWPEYSCSGFTSTSPVVGTTVSNLPSTPMGPGWWYNDIIMCSLQRALICLCAVTTAAPTAAPSITPTRAPSAAPIAAPTTAPSAAPSGAPTPPTAMPSVSPSEAPSEAPSAAPTGVPPTLPPTAPPGHIVLFQSDPVYGDFVNTYGPPANAANNICSSAPAAAALNCTAYAIMACFDGYGPADVPATLGVSPASPVSMYTPDALFSAAGSWSAFLASGASPFPWNAWYGCDAAFTESDTCTSWTDSGGSGTWIGANFTDVATGACNELHHFPCACASSGATPYTRAPTPGRRGGDAVIFGGDELFASTAAADDAACNARASFPPTCAPGTAHALVCRPTLDVADFPTALGFDAARPVFSASGVALADTWTDFIVTPLLATLWEAGITSVDAWTGCQVFGTYDPDRGCVGWTSTSGADTGFALSPLVNSIAWVSWDQWTCSTQQGLACVCVVPTPSPTRWPTGES